MNQAIRGRSIPGKSRGRGYALSPIVIEALSISLKHFVDRIIKAY